MEVIDLGVELRPVNLLHRHPIILQEENIIVKGRTTPRRNQGNDAIGKALLQISRSPFSRHIEQAELPCRLNQTTFTIYNGKIDPIEHVSHFN